MSDPVVVRYARSPDATESPVGDRLVLYHRVSRTALVLNPTGTWMWQQLLEPRSMSDLARDLRSRFQSLAEPAAERDVTSFLQNLSQHAMVSIV